MQQNLNLILSAWPKVVLPFYCKQVRIPAVSFPILSVFFFLILGDWCFDHAWKVWIGKIKQNLFTENLVRQRVGINFLRDA